MKLNSYKDDSLTNFIEKAATEPINIDLGPPKQTKKPKPKTTPQALTKSAANKLLDAKNVPFLYNRDLYYHCAVCNRCWFVAGRDSCGRLQDKEEKMNSSQRYQN
ncbi:hypothetical protein RF11_07389 [Thelohanellus kitauei]|uniref:Uncharacterized protein n=1 Tax=Thelohanellus kitauei TaxID=669202 RepID=A0A0C2MGU5_THEKT|nr:hypothetical protein RF11_07189 [Thelohanellus kitauei]KII66396.1 hypothetical protein RF11_07389 [Thelohanellus kitauei]